MSNCILQDSNFKESTRVSAEAKGGFYLSEGSTGLRFRQAATMSQILGATINTLDRETQTNTAKTFDCNDQLSRLC